MRVLVLTGTSGFARLENDIVSTASLAPDATFVIQSKNVVQGTANIEHVRFLDMTTFDYSKIDVVVGHCGAGTVFWTLEHRIPLLAVVNLTRPDWHQLDLGDWLRAENLALVLVNRGPSVDELEYALSADFLSYQPDAFNIDRIQSKLV